VAASDIPEFSMRLTADGTVAFVHAAQAHAYLRGLFKKAGAEIAAQFFEYRQQRSARQNRAAHVLFQSWLPAKPGWTLGALKLYVLGDVFGYLEVVHPVSGEVLLFPAEPHTATLSVGQFCLLIERILELAAEQDGVVLVAPDEWQRAKAAAEKQAARAARKVAA